MAWRAWKRKEIGGARAVASILCGTTADAPPDEEERDERNLHAGGSARLAGGDAGCESADSVERFRRSGRAFAFSANAERRPEARQHRDAICAIPYSAWRTARGASAGAGMAVPRTKSNHPAQNRRRRTDGFGR